ncbi:hypothetical protein AAVH_42442, partial [Aphelenchoides avenae]
LRVLLTLGLPREYPIYIAGWAGSPAQAWEWVRHFPCTTFGFSLDFIRRRTDPGNLQFKREIPLENVFLESGTPVPHSDGTFRTTEDVLTLAEFMQIQVGEDHRHILAATTLAAFHTFFPQEIAPQYWICPPAQQTPARYPTVQARLAAIDATLTAAIAPASGLVAPAGPSTSKKGRKPQSTKKLEEAWKTLEGGAFADFIKDKMDEFSPHYTTSQEQEIWRERREFVASTTLNVTVVNTEFLVNVRDNQRVVTEQPVPLRDVNVLPPPPVPPTMTGASSASNAISQTSAAAVAAAAPDTAPTAPDQAAIAAPTAPVLELDRTPWSPADVHLPTQTRPPINTNLYGFNSPRTSEDGRPIYTGWEPLVACPGHGRTATHMTLKLVLKDYRRICRGVSAERRANGEAVLHSFGEMYCVIWAQKFTPLPKTDGIPSVQSGSPGNPAEAQRQPNLSVHDCMTAVLSHEPSALPQTMNRYYRQVTRGTDQQIFTPGEIGTAILRWYESCPTAATYFRTHLTGPVRYYPDFLEGCDPEIAQGFATAWQEFRQALDYVRLRVYMVNVRRHRMWTTPQEASILKKSEIRRIEVDPSRVLQHSQIVLTDTWGDKFMTGLRPEVHVRQLPGLAIEAVDVAKNYFLGHSVERIYIFWGRDELLHGPGYVKDRLFSLSHHFAHEFPYVQCFLILPPYMLTKHESYRTNIKAILDAQESSFANVTLV